AEPGKTVQVEQTRIQHLEGHQQQLNDRVSRYQQELQGMGTQALEEEIGSIRNQLSEVDNEVAELGQQLQATQQQISQSREHNENIVEALNGSRSDLQSQQGRLSSLEALQEDALGKGESAVSDWLDQNGLKDAKRLAETLDVEQRWQTAVETVLGFHLQAVSVDEAGNLGQALAGLDKGAIGIIERGAVKNSSTRDLATSLAQFVRSDWSLDSLLAGIYTADSIDQALSLRGQLQAHESIVTAEGVWLGPNWMRMTRNTDEQAGVLQREAEIRDTEKRIAELTARVDDLQQQLDAGRDALHAHERSRDETQASLDAANRQHAEYKSTLGSRETALEQMRSRSQQIETQLGELHGQLEQDSSAVQEARARLQEAEAAAAKLDAERAQLQQRRDI
ncbi:MAG: hypothetical protein HKM22_03665, partial [Gammaproteobacteria bacterium]|nr:hypothetical protein [Gammaproteobacteria bacterium]